MGKTRFILVLAVLALLLPLPAAALAYQPPAPTVFGGTAILDGASAPEGTTVRAVIDGNEVSATDIDGNLRIVTIAVFYTP